MTDQPSTPEPLPEQALRLENRWRKADDGMARVSRADEADLAKKAEKKDEQRVEERATHLDKQRQVLARHMEQVAKREIEPIRRALETVQPRNDPWRAQQKVDIAIDIFKNIAAELRQ